MSIIDSLTERENKVALALNYIERTQELFEKYASAELKADRSLFEKLIEGLKSDKVRLVVIGEFSRGKSRLVNALLGIDLLPSAKQATTAVNTFLQSPPNHKTGQKYISLNFTDSNKPPEILNWTDDNVLKKWGTELDTEHKDARSELLHIDVFAPHELLDKGLVIIDTPGLESVMEHHEAITKKAIASSHIAIWVQSVEALGGNKREWQFLSDTIRENFRKFITVINMWDQVLVPNKGDADYDKPESERVEKSLNTVKKNFREYLQDVSSEELDKMTNDEHLMGVSAAWALSDDSEQRRRSGIDKLTERIAELCTSGEAQEEIFYKPLQQLSSLQKKLISSMDDELKALNDSRDIQERQNELKNLEAEIKNQELEQRTTAQEFKGEHARAAKVIITDIKNNLADPLSNLKNELNHFLTKDFVKREIEAGNKNISLPKNMQEKYQQVTAQVSEKWVLQTKQLESSLNDLKADYIDAMTSHSVHLRETLGEMSIELPSMDINLKVDLSRVIQYQKKKMELESQLDASKEDLDIVELELDGLSLEERKSKEKSKNARMAYERAQRNLADLGSQPTPHSYNVTREVSDSSWYNPFSWGSTKHVTVTKYDDSNVKQYQNERGEIKAEIANREQLMEQFMKEAQENEKVLLTKQALQRKAEQRIKKLEDENKKQLQALAKEEDTIIENTLRELRFNVMGEVDSRIKFLEKDFSNSIEKIFTDQLDGLLKCVEEQFMQPLRAKQAKREEVLQLFEEGKAEIENRKNTLANAKKELESVIEFTTNALKN